MYKIIFRKLNFDTLALVPDKTIFKFDEADNILRAILELYRFTILSDAQGWFGFVKELGNCYSKLAN